MISSFFSVNFSVIFSVILAKEDFPFWESLSFLYEEDAFAGEMPFFLQTMSSHFRPSRTVIGQGCSDSTLA